MKESATRRHLDLDQSCQFVKHLGLLSWNTVTFSVLYSQWRESSLFIS